MASHTIVVSIVTVAGHIQYFGDLVAGCCLLRGVDSFLNFGLRGVVFWRHEPVVDNAHP